MKPCFKCGAEKPLSEFYKNSSMADGRVNKCKQCTKIDVRLNRASKADYYRTYDKERFQNDPRVRARHKRYQSTEAGKAAVLKSTRRYRAENPEKHKATNAVNNAIRDGRLRKLDACEFCGSQDNIEGHHPSYAEDMRLCVTWLCSPCHKRAHHPF